MDREEHQVAIRQLIDALPHDDHRTRVITFVVAVQEATGLHNDEFTEVLRQVVGYLHGKSARILILGEPVCVECGRPGIVRVAPDGVSMLCEMCIWLEKEGQLMRWKVRKNDGSS